MPRPLGVAILWALALAPGITALVVIRKSGFKDHGLRWVCMAYLVSMPGEVGTMFGYHWAAEWASSNLYPVLQLSLFALAVSWTTPALLVGLGLTLLTSGHIAAAGIIEPGTAVQAAGGLTVGLLAAMGPARLRPAVVTYTVAGAIAWVLWFPYMEVYGWQAWLGWSAYQATRIVSMGLLIWAAYKWREA